MTRILTLFIANANPAAMLKSRLEKQFHLRPPLSLSEGAGVFLVRNREDQIIAMLDFNHSADFEFEVARMFGLENVNAVWIRVSPSLDCWRGLNQMIVAFNDLPAWLLMERGRFFSVNEYAAGVMNDPDFLFESESRLDEHHPR